MSPVLRKPSPRATSAAIAAGERRASLGGSVEGGEAVGIVTGCAAAGEGLSPGGRMGSIRAGRARSDCACSGGAAGTVGTSGGVLGKTAAASAIGAAFTGNPFGAADRAEVA